jgi:putative restriction endonuclease
VKEPQKIWLRRLAHLSPNVSAARGDGAARFAPHKPLLLLALIEAVEAGEITTPQTALTAGLRLRFNALWQIVVRRWTTKPDPTLPFHHLSTQCFWEPLRSDGRPSDGSSSTRQIRIDPAFFELLHQPMFRQLARTLLVATWFPPEEQVGLRASLGLDLLKPPDPSLLEEARAQYETAGRDARFRIQVIVHYHYTCALTGYTLTSTESGASIVHAAHIAAFADTRNNDPRNGLALTPDAHWSFDEGLWTVDDDLRIVVAADKFSDWSPEGSTLRQRHGRPLHFAARAQLRPDLQYLAWHREKRFLG